MSKLPHTERPLAPSSLQRSPEAEELRLRRRRSRALGLSLGALAVIFFVVTILKMAAQIAPPAS